jgi:hypothetical protein
MDDHRFISGLCVTRQMLENGYVLRHTVTGSRCQREAGAEQGLRVEHLLAL